MAALCFSGTVNTQLVAHAQLKISARGKYRSSTTKFNLEVAKYAVNNSKLAASKKFGIHRNVGTNLV